MAIEMEYQKRSLRADPIFLASEKKGKYSYYVLSMGSHPCAYIELPKDHPYFDKPYSDIPILCHGGLTYGSSYLNTISNNDEERYFIGWDYAHYGDYVYYDSLYLPVLDGKKWTTNEMIQECLDVISQLEELE